MLPRKSLVLVKVILRAPRERRVSYILINVDCGDYLHALLMRRVINCRDKPASSSLNTKYRGYSKVFPAVFGLIKIARLLIIKADPRPRRSAPTSRLTARSPFSRCRAFPRHRPDRSEVFPRRPRAAGRKTESQFPFSAGQLCLHDFPRARWPPTLTSTSNSKVSRGSRYL